MAVVIKASHSKIVIGKAQDMELALKLDSIPIDHQIVELPSGDQALTAFLMTLGETTSLQQRYIKLISRVLSQLEESPANDPVFWVMPWFELRQEEVIESLIHKLKIQFPFLFLHPQTRFFPYGRASVIMALNQATQLMAKQPDQRVWLIGFDSLNNPEQSHHRKAMREDFFVPSEGAIVTCLEAAESGLSIKWVDSEACSGTSKEETHQDLAIKQLFTQLAAQMPLHLSHLYFPDNGRQDMTAAWSNHYERLAPCISKETEIHLTAYATGELGAAGGLYRFLHLYQALKKERIQGTVLQCEIADRLYRALAVYEWSRC